MNNFEQLSKYILIKGLEFKFFNILFLLLWKCYVVMFIELE